LIANNNLKANWLIGILLSIVGTLTFLGWSANERRVTALEEWRIQHEKLVAVEMRIMTKQLTMIESEIKWIRRELERRELEKKGGR